MLYKDVKKLLSTRILHKNNNEGANSLQTINERIKILRKNQGLTLEKFGAQLGVTKTAISSIENGKRGVTEQMVKSICREFRISESWLRHGIGSMGDTLSKNDELAICIQDLLDDTDNIVAAAIKEFIMIYYMKMDDASKQNLQNIASHLFEALKNRDCAG